MNYNPKEYWQKRGENYSVSVDTSQELVNLSNLLWRYGSNEYEILEIGSGYGRIYNYLHERFLIESNYHMCDFVDSMITECYLQTTVKPDKWDGKTLPYRDDSFDWVISFSVLLHVPPRDIYNHFSEMIRVARKYIYIATYVGGMQGLAEHCFRHYYERDLFPNFDLKIVSEKFFMGAARVNWLLEKEN